MTFRSLCTAAILLSVLLQSGVLEAQIGPGPGPGPPPPPQIAGICAYEYMGSANGVHYYTLCTCIGGVASEPFGYGESSEEVDIGCNGDECITSLPPAMTMLETPDGLKPVSVTDVIPASLIVADELPRRLKPHDVVQFTESKLRSLVPQKQDHSAALIEELTKWKAEYEALNDPAEIERYEVAFAQVWAKHDRYLNSVSVATAFPVNAKPLGSMISLDRKTITTVPPLNEFRMEANAGFRMVSPAVAPEVVRISRPQGDDVYFRLFEIERAAGGERLRLGQQIMPVSNLPASAVGHFVDIQNFAHVIRYRQLQFAVVSANDLTP
jgi:hypothetical protein